METEGREDNGDQDFDEGPDLDKLRNGTLTLTPDTRLPTEMDNRPPDLPPKQSRRQHNGSMPGIGNDSAVSVEDNPPPVAPRRREKKDQVLLQKC